LFVYVMVMMMLSVIVFLLKCPLLFLNALPSYTFAPYVYPSISITHNITITPRITVISL